MMKTAPEFLTPRKDKPHPEKWVQKNAMPVLGAVSAEWSSGVISATVSDTPSSQALQQYALIKARFGIDEIEMYQLAEESDLQSTTSLRIADQIANLATMKKLGALNKEIPTFNGKQIAQNYAQAHPQELIIANCNLFLTGEHARFMREIKKIGNPEVVREITELNKQLTRTLRTNQLCNTNEVHYAEMTIGASTRIRLAKFIERYVKKSDVKKETAMLREKFGKRPELIEAMSGFYDLVVSKPDRTLSHSGRMGRSKKGEQFGRNLTRPHNYYGDNERRVFTRYKSGKGAVIVLDLSGSMSLTSEQVDQMIESAHGSTIIGYSQGGETEPNCWVIAHNNSRMKGIPRVRGGNGVDVPALLFADTYRKPKQPLVWVSDGHATGKNDDMTEEIMQATAKTVLALDVHQVIDIESALVILAKMQRGLNPKPEMCSMLWRYV